MSTDGPGLFADDTAHDVRAEFGELFSEYGDAERATSVLISRWAEFLASADQADVFWLALAATQTRFGCLCDDVRDRAVEIIDAGFHLRRWDGLPSQRKRADILRRLRAQLLGPQPPAKVPSRKRRREPPRIDLASPDGGRLARAIQMGSLRGHPVCTIVLVFAGRTGVSAFQVQCALAEVTMTWRSDSELEVSYPKHAFVQHRHQEVSVGCVATRLTYDRRS